ncbi:MAG: 3-oxoacyl-ACP synthase [Deltaproteobacteria bacterium]|nr:3-oxoacyl-ACP synthase [Deltaproteobacteria bacterium]
MKDLAITAVNSITAVGHDAAMTAAAVRAGITRFSEFDEYLDREGNPVTVARIRGSADNFDTAERMGEIAVLCLENLLVKYFSEAARRPSRIRLFLGTASADRPGPRYEDSCKRLLIRVMENRADKTDLQIIPMGNASMPYALAEASRVVESNANTLCIVGGIDSLLRDSILNWFEQDGRLKSVSYGRHQGLIAGEAVCFLTIEDNEHTRQANRPILARITGLGLAEEPAPRASNASGRGTGLSEACRTALNGKETTDIKAVFGDLNGENSRALEWSIAENSCFRSRDERRMLWAPANCYGDVGAACGGVMASVASHGFVRGWVQDPVLLFCSDDHGVCGAMVLEKA